MSQLSYKAIWYGRNPVKIDMWYPLRKRCFACGYVLDSLAFDIREWDCPECGIHHDRVLNVGKNFVAAG
ncbi:transposase [Ktedonospora formicarum]|uniref:transposase n=1 Tax=Ktedonospora formicarum TaxID=2778364 RepID=UPI001F351E04|nr:transposase [Ktedonospora formicarum]